MKNSTPFRRVAERRPKNNCAGVIPLPAMTERRAVWKSRSLWSIIEVDKITAGLVPAQIKAARPAGVTGTARRPTERAALLAFAYTRARSSGIGSLEKGIKNGLGDGLMRETMPLQTIS